MNTNHNRIKVADLETNEPDKILSTNASGELEFKDINSIKVDSYNGLDYTQEGKALDARQGKILKDLIASNGNAPYLDELIPNHFLPNITNNIIVKGSFFTPETIISIQGQVVNSIKFKSDNEIIVNVTTGNTEGSFDITIDNGTSKTYPKVLLIALGEVFKPKPTDWINKSGLINTDTEGELHTVNYKSYGSAVMNKEIDWNKDWDFQFYTNLSPLGTEIVNPNPQFLTFNSVIDNSEKLSIWFWIPHAITSTPPYINLGNGQPLFPKFWKLRYVNKVLYLYGENNNLLHTYATNPFTENVKASFNVYTYDFTDIKYIELATS